jgi:hypothetical protein
MSDVIPKNVKFTFDYIETEYSKAIDAGYTFLSCFDYVSHKHAIPSLSVVNRVDIDFSIKKAERLLEIFDRLKICATFFVRLHAPEYNPFSFENYRILKKIRDSGHEIGLHSEIIDQSEIWHEDPADCLRRDIEVLNSMLDLDIRGVASHGGKTGLNNLDFWQVNKAQDFNLSYEAYENSPNFNLFHSSIYLSDSEWTQWKTYRNGQLENGNRQSLSEHLKNFPPLIYLLVHSDTWFDAHIYE